MPIFSRPDGTPVRDVAPVRAIMPFIMQGRNESIVFHETAVDLTRTLPWIAAFNEGRPEPARATLFHLFLWAAARTLHERPGINRFVSGGRLYQRNDVTIAFAAKRAMRDGEPIVTVKAVFPEGEPFDACVMRLRASIAEGRSGKPRPIDTEVDLVMRLPGFVIRAGVWLLRWLDGVNLMPAKMIEGDPMYSSLFAANIGSVGLDAVYHHLYEYGNTSLFGVVGRIENMVVAGDDGAPAVREGVRIRWSFDERINDGLYGANSLAIARRYMENPGG